MAHPWLRAAAGVVMAVAAGGTMMAVAFAPPALPLQPLATPATPADGHTHVLVSVPSEIVTTTVATTDGRSLELPAPLSEIALQPGVVDVSRVGATTWRVTGSLSAETVSAASGLPASDDVLMQINGTDDTYWSLLWGLENRGGSVGGFPARADADVDGPEASDKATGSGVVVAIVDSGVQPDHPDLPSLWRNRNEVCGNGVDDDANGYTDDCTGWDFVRHDNTPYDTNADNNHGTHVSGTIAAIPNNGRGVAGLAPGVSLMSLKITENGSIYLSNAAEAIRYAADQGAKIVNASFGTSPGTPREAVAALEDAITYARSKGVVVVTAAGNNGVDTDARPVWPADLPLDNIISVGASTAEEKPASFSNTGATSVDLFAPGHYIASTVDGGGYSAMQGTSMATPHVTAAAALVLSQTPTMSPVEVRDRLLGTVDQTEAYRDIAVSGGRLNADRALDEPASPKVSVEAASFDEFVANESHTGTLTISASADLFPASPLVTWQATLLLSAGGVAYGVVEHPVVVDGSELATDTAAQVLLGPADGVPAASSALTGNGVRVAVGTMLPPGEYALVIDIVAATDRRYAYGPSVAVFFTVPEPGQPSPTATDPPPAATDPPPDPAGGGGEPGIQQPSVPGSEDGSAPGGTIPGSGTAPGDGTIPGSTIPGNTVPGGGTLPGGESVPGSGSIDGSPGGGTGGGTRPDGNTGDAGGSGDDQAVGGGPAPGGTSPTTGTSSGPRPEPGGQTSNKQPVTHDGITIISIDPSHGGGTGGDTIMIIGDRLPDYPVVYIGGSPAPVVSRGISSVSVRVPSGIPTSAADVTVADRTGRAVTMPGGFVYDPAPAPSTPASGGNAPGSTTPDDGSTPGNTTPDSGTMPGTPAPGGGSTPRPVVPTPVVPTPTATTPPGPDGTTFRPPPTLGTPTTRTGLRVAPVIAGSPVVTVSPSQWGTKRCIMVVCAGVPVSV
ncbi:MAG: S8 family serine peptidase [Dactylosporangium sp.]|nr:S8 family serine peptidase [Dactylosporangium sp.]NNJ60895.1 S8 family serine peptidase [Dactylosporangium sp.]